MAKHDFGQCLKVPFICRGRKNEKLFSVWLTAHFSSPTSHVHPDPLLWNEGVYADDCKTGDDPRQQRRIARNPPKRVEIPRLAKVLNDTSVCASCRFHFAILFPYGGYTGSGLFSLS